MSNSPLARYSFLIVEDEKFMANLVDRALRQAGATDILQASDGATAVRVLKDLPGPVSCIICDVNMRPVNGLQLLRGIRTGKIPHIPRNQKFVMLTGHGEPDVVEGALEFDIDGYLVKPVSPDKLMKTLSAVMERKSDTKPADHYAALIPAVEPKPENSPAPTMPMGKTVWRRPKSKPDTWLQDKLAEIRAAGRSSGDQPRFRDVHSCALKDLKPDMIIAEDIVDDHGIVLITAGISLTESFVRKLSILAEEDKTLTHIKVGKLIPS